MTIKIGIIISLILLLVFVSLISYRNDNLVLKVVIDGELHEMKINGVVDTGRQYQVGQKYKVTHHFLFGNMVKREIELVE